MKICVLGIGFIGLPTACLLASVGFHVLGVDINEDYLNKLKSKKIKLKEKNLNELLDKALNKTLILDTKPNKADIFIICTPTPLDKDNSPDLTYLIEAINSILPYLEKGNIIIIESTIPPKTTREIIKPKIEDLGFKIGRDVYLAYCPERVLPGNILYELIHNNRIIGGCTENCSKMVKSFYEKFVEGEIHTTTAEIAEMVKLVENSYRDVTIAFANEVLKTCNELNINPYEVIFLANKHPRVNLPDFGIGVGGHCLPIDPYFIISSFPKTSKLISTARKINDSMPRFIVSKIEKFLARKDNPKIGIWGLSYKKNTSDIRNSPSLEIVNILQAKGYNVKIYDPLVEGINYDKIKFESVMASNFLIILVDHDEFIKEDFKELLSLMDTPIILDLTNITEKITLPEDVEYYNLMKS
ncbi:MAG: nucleotide sugar dehydrogenase [Tissierellia bacterium]|nr:nucleotide sugar dehydrogenase [Tissierellia bacterium]